MTLFSPSAFLSSVFMLVLCVSVPIADWYFSVGRRGEAVFASLLGTLSFFGMLLCWFWPLAGRLV